MQDRPVVVKEGGGNSVAMFAILAILVLVGLALFIWQPWNANGTSTTKVIVQPGAQSAGSAGAGTTSGNASGGSSAGTNH